MSSTSVEGLEGEKVFMSKHKMVNVRNLYKGSAAFEGIPYGKTGQVPEAHLENYPGCFELLPPDPGPEPTLSEVRKAASAKRRKAPAKKKASKA